MGDLIASKPSLGEKRDRGGVERVMCLPENRKGGERQNGRKGTRLKKSAVLLHIRKAGRTGHGHRRNRRKHNP